MILTFVLLDAAQLLDKLEKAQALNSNYVSLYNGQSREALSIVAPYLFSFQIESDFAVWLAESGWGRSWGIYFSSDASPQELHHHFRKFLIVQNENGQELYFRFYDPRILRVFLPTCDEEQLRGFFGPVSHFMMEDADPNQVLVFSLKEGKLYTEIKPAKILVDKKTQLNE